MKRHFLLFLIVITTLSMAFSAVPAPSGQAAHPADPSSQSSAFKAYLPVVRRHAGESLWGVQVQNLGQGPEMNQVVNAGASWIRSGLVWELVESTPGARSWEANAGFEQTYINASRQGMQVIAVVDGTPDWAEKPGYGCGGAVASEQFEALGNFLYDAVVRLSAPPYNVRYWELWNEPDSDPIYKVGCWGDPTQPDFGGSYYAEMLKVVYPRIKQADPNAQVLVGGLLLDCDPRPNANIMSGGQPKDCSPARFIEGIVANGGGDFFNGVSFHAYDYFYGGAAYQNPNWNSAQNTTGPVTRAKAAYLREVLDAAGLYHKYLLNTETALFYDPGSASSCAAPDYVRAKNNYILEVYASSLVDQLRSTIWWSAMGHRCSGLLNPDHSPQPAYFAYQFARQKLGQATYLRQLNQQGILGYEFRVANRTVWVLRSLGDAPIRVALTNPQRIYKMDEDGRPDLQPLTNSIEVGSDMVLIEF